jgi:hypothetical protein
MLYWYPNLFPSFHFSLSLSLSLSLPFRLYFPRYFCFSVFFYVCVNGHTNLHCPIDRLCGLVVRVPGYRYRAPGFDSRRYQIFWEVVGLERGPLSPVRIIEELLECKSSCSGQGNRVNGRGDPLRWLPEPLYPQKLALTSPTSGGRSVGIVRLRTKSHGV